MATSATVLYARVVAALRTNAVASAAGVGNGVWSSSSTPRVFQELQGYLGGRNRGRLPFIEFDIDSQNYNKDHFQGGTLTSLLRIRAHCGLRDVVAAGTLIDSILTSALAAVRSEAVDNYTALGDDQVSLLEYGVWGHYGDATMTIVQSYASNDYEVV